jgi:hypothetical protein
MSEYLFDILARVIYRKLESPFTVKLGFCKPVRKFRIFQGARSFFMSISSISACHWSGRRIGLISRKVIQHVGKATPESDATNKIKTGRFLLSVHCSSFPNDGNIIFVCLVGRATKSL